MLIPKITFTGYINSGVVAPVINNFSFKNDSSLSEGITIVSSVWSVTNLTGVPVILFGGSTTEMEFTVGIQDIIQTARIELSTTDSLGRTARTSMLVVNNGAGNINLINLELDTFVLPNGIVVLNPVEKQVTALGVALYGASPFFSTYDIDFTNNAVFDDSNPTGAAFETQYATTGTISALLSMTDLINGFILNDLYTEATFEAVIETPVDVIVTSNVDCTLLTVSSESTDLVEKLIGRAGVDNSEMKYLGLQLEQNCCNNSLDLKLAPQYDFSLAIVPGSELATTTVVSVGGNDYLIYLFSLQLNGLNIAPDCITSVQYTAGNNSDPTLTTLVGITNPIVLGGIETLVPAVLPSGLPVIVETNKIIITTIDGFVYTLDYTITPSYGGIVTYTISTVTTTYPPLPTGITIVENVNNTVIEITPSAITSTTTVFWDGIYQITLNDSGTSNSSITGCTFVDCETYCLIIKALANGCTPLVQILYDALTQFNQCTDIPCANICDLFAYLETLLNECDCTIYQNTIISKRNGCGCNS